MIDEENARRLKLIPYMFDKSRANVIWVAMADPMDIMAIDDASIITGMEVVPVLSKLSDIQVVIDKFFGKAKALAVAEAYKQEQEYMTMRRLRMMRDVKMSRTHRLYSL